MAIVIPLALDGKDELDTGFKKIAGAVKEFRDELGKLRRSLARPIPSAQVGAAQSARGASAIGQAAQQASGPVANLARAYKQLQQAQASGDPSKLFDASYAVHLAANRYNRARKAMQPKTTWDLVKDAVMTSRVGAGGGLMPLVNRLVPILGKAGPIGMLAVAVVGLVAGTKRLIEAMDSLAKLQRQTSQNRYTAGATYAQTYRMEVLGGATGGDGSSVAQASRAFADVLANGGWAAGMWRRFGISDTPGPYGKVNKFDNLEKAVQQLMKMPEREAVRLARESGLEEFLSLRDASPSKLKELFDAQKKLITPESARAAADFNVELARLRLELQSLIPYLSPVVSFMASYVSGIRKTVELSASLASVYASMATGDFVGAASKAGDLLRRLRSGNDKDVANAARDRNTEAVNENTRELRRTREVIGGGSRARGALPGAWRYEALNRQLDALGTALGGM